MEDGKEMKEEDEIGWMLCCLDQDQYMSIDVEREREKRKKEKKEQIDRPRINNNTYDKYYICDISKYQNKIKI